jgi:hypothetical protein
MKVVDYQTAPETGGKSSLVGRLISDLGSMPTRAGTRAQETTIQTLKKVLNNRFVILRGLVLPDLEQPAPLLLVGPPGVWLIEASPIKGLYRATEDQWEEMDGQTQKFRPAKVNLPARTAAMAQLVAATLTDRGLDVLSVEPVVYFTQPGAHIEALRPPSRLVQSDGLVRFATGLLQSQILLEPEDVQHIVDSLKAPAPEPVTALDDFDLGPLSQTEGSAQAAQQRKEVLSAQLSAALNTDEPEIVRRLSRRAAFSRRQWLILAALLVVNILVFIAIIIVVQIIT